MSRAFASFLGAAALLTAPTLCQEPVEQPMQEAQVHTVDDLLTYVKQRERAVEALSMEITSTGSFPDGSSFHTEGTLRVLGTTHFHARMKADFGEDMQAETETVRTPDGIQMRERDPVQGEVFVRMDRATMERVDSATKVLGGDAAVGGFGSREAKSPLGSAILEDVVRQFEVTLRGPQVIDGQRCWVVGGPLKPGLTDEDELFGLGADQVDAIVRVGDGAVIQMTQLRQGSPLLEVKIGRLDLDPKLDPASFELSTPPRAAFVDVMVHPPAREQLDRLFEEARAKGWTDPAAAPVKDAEGEPRKEGDGNGGR